MASPSADTSASLPPSAPDTNHSRFGYPYFTELAIIGLSMCALLGMLGETSDRHSDDGFHTALGISLFFVALSVIAWCCHEFGFLGVRDGNEREVPGPSVAGPLTQLPPQTTPSTRSGGVLDLIHGVSETGLDEEKADENPELSESQRKAQALLGPYVTAGDCACELAAKSQFGSIDLNPPDDWLRDHISIRAQVRLVTSIVGADYPFECAQEAFGKVLTLLDRLVEKMKKLNKPLIPILEEDEINQLIVYMDRINRDPASYEDPSLAKELKFYSAKVSKGFFKFIKDCIDKQAELKPSILALSQHNCPHPEAAFAVQSLELARNLMLKDEHGSWRFI